MARRYFNWKLLIVLVLGTVILGATAFGLRQWQKSRRAEQGLVRGNKAYDEHNWEEAASQLGRYLGVVQNDSPVLLKYAEAQLNIRPLKQGNLQQAIAAYRNVLRLDQSKFDAVKRLSEIYLSMGMPAEAELIASRALAVGESEDIRRILAMALAGQRKFTKASNELKAVLEKNPAQISAYELLGRLIEQRPDEFSETPDFWFNEAIKKNPSSAEAYIARSAYYLRLGDRAGAIADLEQAQQKDINDSAVRLRLAEELINADVLDAAQKHLEIVQTSEPANYRLWLLWAKIAIKSDSNDIILKVADAGLKELSAQPWDFMPYAAELFIKCGRFERAKECIDMMRQKDIAPETTAFLEGLLAEKQGLNLAALKGFRNAIELGSKSPRVRLSLANTLWRLSDKQSAINQLRTLVSQQPAFPDGHIALAQMLSEVGQWAETLEQTRISKQLAGQNSRVDLLEVRAKLQMLKNSGVDTNSPQYRDLQASLDDLDKTTAGAVEVKLLEIRLAIQRGDFAAARNLVADLKKAYPSEISNVLAETDLLVAQDRIDDAILKVQEASKTFPKSTAVLKTLVALLTAKGAYQQCENLLTGVIAGTEQPAEKREITLLLADVYRRSKDSDKRYSLLHTLAGQLQDDILVQRELLTCEQVLKNPGLAQQVVDRIKNVEGDDGWQWRFEQAKIWFYQDDFKNRYPQIVGLLQQNLQTNPDDQASRLLLATTYERGQDLRLAVSTYVEALNRSPKDVRIIATAVAAFYKAGEYDRAEEVLRQAAKEGISHPELERLEMQSSLRRGDIAFANEALEEMHKRDPNDNSVALSLALLRIRQDKFEQAQELLEELRTREPNSLPVAAALAELDIRMGKPDDAERICDDMVAKLHTTSAILFRGRTLAVLKKLDKARDDFDSAVKLDPDNTDAWIAKCLFHLSIKESNEAVAVIREALSLIPDDLKLKKTAVSVYFASDDRDLHRQGEAILDKALESNPEDIDLRLQKTRLLLAKGTAQSFAEASDILLSVTEKQPHVKDAWVLLAQMALQEGKPAKAMDACLQGLAHRPNDRTLLLLKAKAEGARSPELALPTLRALWELDPNNAETAVTLAEAYMAAGENSSAVNLLKNQPLPEDISQQQKLNLALAVAMYKYGSKAEAEQLLQGLYESEPNNPRPLLAQIQLLRNDKSWDKLRQKIDAWTDEHSDETQTAVFISDELASSRDSESVKMAEELLRHTLGRDPGSALALFRLAILLQSTGRPTDAAPFYQRALELQPDNLIAINNLAWILCEDQKRPQEALGLIQRGLEKAPEYVDLIDTRGMAYYRLGKFDLAAKDFDECIRLYPGNNPGKVASYFHSARCLADSGEKIRAIEQLSKALELNKELGGLSGNDLAEAQQLLEQLKSGGN